MLIVTSYKNPDLDGVACSIAYTELLKRLGKEVKATYCGDLNLEIDFVKKFTNYFPIEKHKGNYNINDKFILVDSADPEDIEKTIPLSKVIEIYDHRQLVFLNKFVNAKTRVELVGSCATLITEEFQKNGLEVTTNIATYLYSAIISNTINLKNSVTTKRDIDAVKWLKKFTSLPKDYVKKMFISKSSITADNLYQVLFQDFAIKNIGNKKASIAQIEIVDLENTLKKLNNELLDALHRLKNENNLDYVFFSGVDILEGFNIFYTIDSESNNLFSKILGIPKLKSGYKTDYIIMRKEIWPKLEATLKNFKLL